MSGPVTGAGPAGMIDGVPVVVTSDRRRYGDLPDDVPCTPEFRAEFNEWSRRFFPPDPALNVVKDGEMFMAGGRLYVNPRTHARILEAVKQEAIQRAIRGAVR